jgi:hypothetical protein
LDPDRRVPFPLDTDSEAQEIEVIFQPLEEGGYHVFAADFPGLHTQGEDLDEAAWNAEEGLALCIRLPPSGMRITIVIIRTSVINGSAIDTSRAASANARAAAQGRGTVALSSRLPRGCGRRNR